jgi:hypothetical protein
MEQGKKDVRIARPQGFFRRRRLLQAGITGTWAVSCEPRERELRTTKLQTSPVFLPNLISTYGVCTREIIKKPWSYSHDNR